MNEVNPNKYLLNYTAVGIHFVHHQPTIIILRAPYRHPKATPQRIVIPASEPESAFDCRPE